MSEVLTITDLSVLPQWRCHKVVRAARIEAIEDLDKNPTITVRLYSPGDKLDYGPGHRLTLVSIGQVDVAGGWVSARKAVVGGYFVVYDDGYTSFSPADAFEAGYTLLNDADIVKAQTSGVEP